MTIVEHRNSAIIIILGGAGVSSYILSKIRVFIYGYLNYLTDYDFVDVLEFADHPRDSSNS